MRNDSDIPAVADRRDDPTPTEQLPPKPPVLRRSTIRWLSAACLAVIVYGTLGPLGLHGQPWLAPADGWSWIPIWVQPDYNDVFTNFLVYVPVGIAFRLLVRRRGWAGPPDMVVGLVLSLGLSYGTEVAQQFMPARSSSLGDCLVNGVAALLGCILAPQVQTLLRRGHAAAFRHRHLRSWTLLAWITAAVTGGLMVVPLYPAAPSWDLSLSAPLDIVDVRRFGMFVVLGFCMTTAAVQRYGNRPVAVRAAMLPTFVLAIGFELLQMFIATHTCGLRDMFIAALGGTTGAAGATKFAQLGLIGEYSRHRAQKARRPNRERTRRILTYVALLCTVICVVAFGLARSFTADPVTLDSVVCWTPFRAHFMQPFHRVVTELVESLALYGFLTLLCLWAARGRGRVMALLLVLGIVGCVESYRALSLRAAADVTPLLLAAVAWLITVRVWNALTPPRPRASAARPEATPVSP